MKCAGKVSKCGGGFGFRLLLAKFPIYAIPLGLRFLAERLGLAVGLVQRLGVGLARRLFGLGVALAGLLQGVGQRVCAGAVFGGELFFERAAGEAAGAAQVAVGIQGLAQFFQLFLPVSQHGLIRLREGV